MDDLDQLIATARAWQAASQRFAVAILTKTWGSAPRRTGAMMLIRADGLFAGSVSGGCVEGAVIARAGELLAAGGGGVIEAYGVSDAMAWEVGLACGGKLDVAIQTVDDAHFRPELFEQIAATRASGLRLRVAEQRSLIVTGSAPLAHTSETAETEIDLGPRLRLAVVGAVHIAQALLPMARLAGYQVTLIDPRSAFAAAERFTGELIDDRWPDAAIAAFAPDAGSAVVVLSHDPKLDDPALIAALASPAFYIAALGSRASQAKRLDRLRALGVAEDQLARIHGPAGFAIGAINPAEIAVSIVAQMTARLRITG
jgi:xanthine dehydrogenase accessory factor